jgi:hypothetical protein
MPVGVLVPWKEFVDASMIMTAIVMLMVVVVVISHDIKSCDGVRCTNCICPVPRVSDVFYCDQVSHSLQGLNVNNGAVVQESDVLPIA